MRFFLSFNYSGPLFIDLASWLKERVFPFERWRRQIESSQLPNLPNIWAWHCLSSSTLSLFLVFLPSWLLRRRTFLISCKPRRWCVKTKSFPIESGKAGFIRNARRSNYIRSALLELLGKDLALLINPAGLDWILLEVGSSPFIHPLTYSFECFKINSMWLVCLPAWSVWPIDPPIQLVPLVNWSTQSIGSAQLTGHPS